MYEMDGATLHKIKYIRKNKRTKKRQSNISNMTCCICNIGFLWDKKCKHGNMLMLYVYNFSFVTQMYINKPFFLQLMGLH